MVLFSCKTLSPLAALTLKADDVGCLSMLTGRPAPDRATEPYFQGMLNMPDQPFSFTITNLSDKCMINFNILHTPHRVSEVDPGPAYGINEVNELHATESYTIHADQRTNRQLVLTGKTKAAKGHAVPVTVEESESTEKHTGLYFYLSVVPDKVCKVLREKFAEGTVWKVVPGFVRGVPAPKQSRALRNTQRHAPEPSVQPSPTIPSWADTWSERRSCEGAAASDVQASLRMTCGSTNQASASAQPVSHPETSAASMFAEPVNVGSTQAAELKYGSRVEVHSSYTGHEYAYEHCSEPTVLCMSIWHDMKFLPLNNIFEELSEQVEEWVKHEGKALIESLNAVFRTDTCVIDLESEADTIVCTCGHQCVNHTNVRPHLRKCPLCRSPITAFVRADGILVE